MFCSSSQVSQIFDYVNPAAPASGTCTHTGLPKVDFSILQFFERHAHILVQCSATRAAARGKGAPAPAQERSSASGAGAWAEGAAAPVARTLSSAPPPPRGKEEALLSPPRWRKVQRRRWRELFICAATTELQKGARDAGGAGGVYFLINTATSAPHKRCTGSAGARPDVAANPASLSLLMTAPPSAAPRRKEAEPAVVSCVMWACPRWCTARTQANLVDVRAAVFVLKGGRRRTEQRRTSNRWTTSATAPRGCLCRASPLFAGPAARIQNARLQAAAARQAAPSSL